MKKILSIILALGLVLSMSLAAMPAAAQTTPVGCGTVVPVTDCAGATATYTITFDSPVTLLAGNDILSFSFGAGTTFATPAGAVTISVDGDPAITVPALTVVRAAPDIQFVLPAGASIDADDEVIVVIAGVKNPAAGKYTMGLGYKFACCDPVMFCSAAYTIKPAKSTYKFVVDFSKTYGGIAEDFVPPFKACGQEGYGWYDEDDDRWFTEFDIILKTDVEGCAGYDPVIMNFWLEEAPNPDCVATLYLFGWNATPTEPFASLDWHEFVLEEDEDGEAPFQWGFAPDGFALDADADMPTEARIHFDCVGDYKIRLELEYLGEDDDCDPIVGGILVPESYDAKVYQWKDAAFIPLNAKWNLISLPLVPFDSSIESILEPLAYPDQLKSIWHYDRCADDWFVHNPGNNVTTLDDIEEARGYWFRMMYPGDGDDYDDTYFPSGLWVFGTARPMPEFGPASYEICEGWTMLGFLPDWDRTSSPNAPLVKAADDYLWNFYSFAVAEFGLVYGWDGSIQDWDVQAHTEDLEPGSGYWVAFERDGILYP